MLISTALTASLLMSVQAAPPPTEPEPPAAPEATEEVVEAVVADPAAPAVQQAAVDDDDKVICRRTAITGSRFKKRLCGTRKEWEEMRNRSKDATQGMQRSGRGLEPDTGG
jgi:hypothetical protein